LSQLNNRLNARPAGNGNLTLGCGHREERILPILLNTDIMGRYLPPAGSLLSNHLL